METLVKEKWMPLGQKLLQNGEDIFQKYPKMSEEQIIEVLGMKQCLKDAAMRLTKKAVDEGENAKIEWKGTRQIQVQASKYTEIKAILYHEDIDYYTLRVPEKALNKVREAMNYGFKKFNVWWTVLQYKESKEIQKCPVITAVFGEDELFITKW